MMYLQNSMKKIILPVEKRWQVIGPFVVHNFLIQLIHIIYQVLVQVKMILGQKIQTLEILLRQFKIRRPQKEILVLGF